MLAWFRRLIGRVEASAPTAAPASHDHSASSVPLPATRQPPSTDVGGSRPIAPLFPEGLITPEQSVGRTPSPAVGTTKPPRLRILIGADRGGSQAAPTRRPDKNEARWIPAGRTVAIHGFEILDGMVYVGRFLTASPNMGQTSGTPAPCLIDPSLKVAFGMPGTDIDLGFWPSYSESSPERRLTYLHWLASGKKDTGYPIGCAFL